MNWKQKYSINQDSSLGSGSFGSVHIATRIQDNFQVCVKLIKKKVEFNENVLATYSQNEFEIAQAIILYPHQNLVQIYDIYYQEINDEYAYIFMEKCEDSLARFIEKQNINEMSLEWIDKLIKDISSGYCELITKHNIIHRDFKPENILYKFENKQPIFKIADFGLGRVINDASEMTRKVGTNKYQAPEVIKSSDYDNRCDIFSFGIVIFEMITGKVGNDSLFKEKKKLQTEKFSTIYQTQLQNLPPQYVNLLDKMICWNHEERISWKDLNIWSSKSQCNIPQNNSIQNYKANFIPQQIPIQPNFNQQNWVNQQNLQNKQFQQPGFNQVILQQQQQNQFQKNQAAPQTIVLPQQFQAQTNTFPPQNQFNQQTNNNSLLEQNSPKNFQKDIGCQNVLQQQSNQPRFQSIITNPVNNFQQDQGNRERKNTGIGMNMFTNSFPNSIPNSQQTMRNTLAAGQPQNFQNPSIQQFPAQNGNQNNGQPTPVPLNKSQSYKVFQNNQMTFPQRKQ